jgi:hypothetical protein
LLFHVESLTLSEDENYTEESVTAASEFLIQAHAPTNEKKRDLLQNIAKSERLKNELKQKPVQCYMKDVSLFYRDGRLIMHAKTHQKDMRIRAYCKEQMVFKSTGNYNYEPSVMLSFQRPMQKSATRRPCLEFYSSRPATLRPAKRGSQARYDGKQNLKDTSTH